MSIIIAGRYQNFTIAIALHGGDEPAFFHLFKKTGRPVVSNAQMALDKRDGCAPVFQDNGYSLIIKRVCLAICRMFPTDTGGIVLCRTAFQYSFDIVGFSVLLQE